jgi:hypothetical protein
VISHPLSVISYRWSGIGFVWPEALLASVEDLFPAEIRLLDGLKDSFEDSRDR